ncbi:CDC48 family AAA ATPase [Natronobeatus ordinarius]|uniref:CDC48 family AAA ATPase n=1 Tax=Natronobeatus ordinarius TaxID=2963433 RepID=UPI0020CD2043|nr:CDC48 family AAA ATPase [Natronobeatus ordinarius]
MNLSVAVARRQTAEGVVVLGAETMADLGLESGDHVSVGADGRRAVATVATGDVDDGGVRLTARLRRSLAVAVGDRVAVDPVAVADAEGVTIALPEELTLEADVGLHVRDALVDRAAVEGQVLTVTLGYDSLPDPSRRRVPIQVTETDPSGPVVVREWTAITVDDEPAPELESWHRSSHSRSAVTYDDVGGLEAELEAVRELVEVPLSNPALFDDLGIEPPTGVLLYGPPGTGKTLMARAVATEVDAHLETISGPEVVSKYYGESEERLREVFERAETNAPAIVFVDEVDSIAPSREATAGDAESRMVAQLLSLLDGLERRAGVAVVGTTNREHVLDPALRRPGRFDREVEVGVPDRDGREEILEIHTRDVPLADDVDLARYADRTHGFVGADLEGLVRESAMEALRRVRTDGDRPADGLEITERDFGRALTGIEPSALREVFVEVPDVSWDDVGGLENVENRLRQTVQWPLEHPEAYERVDLTPAKGLLLYGPPGTGKTLLAKAVANESQSNFISIKGPELLEKYVGESERGVREIFSKARENAPAIVFFDEIDALAGERGRTSADAGVGERVVSQLLTELDGLESLENVVVIATTNRPDLLDDALLRPGRFDRHLHVPVPDEDARTAILEVHTAAKPLADDVDLERLARRTEGYVGADLESICREAATMAVEEYVDGDRTLEDLALTADHFERALAGLEPTTAGDARFELDGAE